MFEIPQGDTKLKLNSSNNVQKKQNFPQTTKKNSIYLNIKIFEELLLILTLN